MLYLVSGIISLGILVGLSVLVLRHGKRRDNAQVVLLPLGGMIVWIGLNLLFWEEVSFFSERRFLISRLTDLVGLGVGMGVVIFMYYFPYVKAHARTVLYVLGGLFLMAVFVIAAISTIFPLHVIERILPYWSEFILPGVLFVWSLLIVKRTIGHLEADTEQRRFMIIGWGIILATVWVLVTQVGSLVSEENGLERYGPLGSVLLAILMIYAILGYRLFAIRLLTAELLLGGIGVVLLILILNGVSVVNVTINIVTFVIYVVVAYFLYKELVARYEKEQELAHTNQELQRIIDTKDDFLRMVSHQLRTPMTSLSGFLSMLVDKGNETYELNEEARAKLVRVYINTQKLSTLVNDILFTNALNADKFGINVREMNMKEIVEGVLENRRYVWEFFEMKMDKRVQGSDFAIQGDPMKIKEVVNTLVDNAIYYGDTQIEIALRENVKEVRFSVKDDGIGISSEEENHVWERFKRSEEAKRRNPNSSGLALYLAHETVKRHGGSLEFESDGRGHGTVFHLSLPKSGPKASNEQSNE